MRQIREHANLDHAPELTFALRRIVTILPKGEGFSRDRFGAVALCVRDFTRASRYRTDTLVVGGEAGGFEGVSYASPPRARWFENRTRAYASGCAKLAHESHAELVEVHNRPVLLRLIGKRLTCRMALHLHNDPQEMEETRTPRERMRLLKRASAVYCVSRYIAGRFLDGMSAQAQDKVHVIHNGIAMPEVLPEKENTIVFAGRMTEGKGALLLAQALRMALPKLPGWRAQLIGSRRHEAGRALTPHEEEIASTLAPLGKQVTLTGFLPHAETLDAFARAHIAVVPSLWPEPFGRTALEAMAYGCATISSGTGGLSEITGDAAFTISTLMPESLAAAIAQLAGDAARRTQLQAQGRERAKLFDIAAVTKTLDAVRLRILSEGPYGMG